MKLYQLAWSKPTKWKYRRSKIQKSKLIKTERDRIGASEMDTPVKLNVKKMTPDISYFPMLVLYGKQFLYFKKKKNFFLKILLLLTAIPATVAQWVNCSSFYRYFTCCLKLKNIIRILAPDRRHLSSFFCFLGGSKKNLWNLFAKFVHITQISI